MAPRFHPEQPDVLLIGDKDGCAKIVAVKGPEAILLGPETQAGKRLSVRPRCERCVVVMYTVQFDFCL